ncbi:aminotransferase class I/II-fold pyridoxal phosphate-dependent enzyme [Paradesertivirga mongoliensis]|uniref:Aminotransferase class I/II-fold pyridoxal phosphate-dependent enzyme n=1 Tax=Paradesertivirga mongoliensis TaxID=2100740 RepID=A0ABW4ZPF3_9SPHI|nr:aminotransferase class I/II-fold pyridoxal phosphate-dependent enzyme [Pedobacter mongoliensis]
MMINFKSASFKDFENIPGAELGERAAYFAEYLNYLKSESRLNYRFEAKTGCGPELELNIPGQGGRRSYVSLVSNDYLGFTQHPEVIAAAIDGILQFGTGAGASPAIGGHYSFHEQLEKKIARFFKRSDAIVYTTGYTANSASLLCLLKKEDLAILDMAVHASVYEGCSATNVKSFLHNNLDALERILIDAQRRYRTRMVIIDGVYSQDGDLAPLDSILRLCRAYGTYLMVDDAHGTGVLGQTGRGLIEQYGLLQEVDIISGTFSKTFAHIGGYVIASRDIIDLLKYQSRQHLFSATLSPACMSILKAIDLIDEEPDRQEKLWENINYFSAGLKALGLNIGNTASAIIPVKIGDPVLNAAAAAMLLRAGVYTNPIMYPAVSRKDARIRMSLMATHTRTQLDRVLNAFDDIAKKLSLPKENYEKSR